MSSEGLKIAGHSVKTRQIESWRVRFDGSNESSRQSRDEFEIEDAQAVVGYSLTKLS